MGVCGCLWVCVCVCMFWCVDVCMCMYVYVYVYVDAYSDLVNGNWRLVQVVFCFQVQTTLKLLLSSIGCTRHNVNESVLPCSIIVWYINSLKCIVYSV